MSKAAGPVAHAGSVARKCYMSEVGKDDGRCEQQARYVATLNWSSQRWYLCEDHAREERAWGDVVEIESLPR